MPSAIASWSLRGTESVRRIRIAQDAGCSRRSRNCRPVRRDPCNRAIWVVRYGRVDLGHRLVASDRDSVAVQPDSKRVLPERLSDAPPPSGGTPVALLPGQMGDRMNGWKMILALAPSPASEACNRR